jgi:hypothetical protein
MCKCRSPYTLVLDKLTARRVASSFDNYSFISGNTNCCQITYRNASYFRRNSQLFSHLMAHLQFYHIKNIVSIIVVIVIMYSCVDTKATELRDDM